MGNAVSWESEIILNKQDCKKTKIQPNNLELICCEVWFLKSKAERISAKPVPKRDTPWRWGCDYSDIHYSPKQGAIPRSAARWRILEHTRQCTY